MILIRRCRLGATALGRVCRVLSRNWARETAATGGLAGGTRGRSCSWILVFVVWLRLVGMWW